MDEFNTFPRARKLFLRGFKSFFKAFSGLSIEGLRNLPPHPPYILAVNHESHLDNLFVASLLAPSLQEKLFVLGKKEHFDHFLTRGMAKLCNAIPVDRNRVSGAVIQSCARLLEEKKILLIHPEGTRTPNGRFLPFKSGAALLANQVHCPLVPVYIEGSFEFWPKSSRLPKRRSRIVIRIGQPLSPNLNGESGTTEVYAAAEALTQKLRSTMEALAEEFKSEGSR